MSDVQITVDPATLVHNKYIDKAYMFELWKRILAIPQNMKITIVDAEGNIFSPAGIKTIVGHLEALYTLVKGAQSEAASHTTVSAVEPDIITVEKNTEGANGTVYTIKVGTTLSADIAAIEAAYASFVKKDDVSTTGTPNDFDTSGSITVDGKKLTVSIPANPADSLVGDTSTDKGLTVTTDSTGKPTVVLEAGEIDTDVDALTTGGKVFDAIKTNLTDEGQKVHKTVQFGNGTLLPGSITITTSNVAANEVADVTFSPVVTTTYGEDGSAKALTNSKLATDGYVTDKLVGLNSEYGLEGNNDDKDKVVLNSGADNIYSGTLTLTEKIDGDIKTGKTVSISIDATQFVADAFLSGSEIVEIDGVKNLRLIVTLADKTTKNIDVPMDKFDDPLVETDSVKISDTNVVSVATSGYVTTDTDGNVTLDATKLEKATNTTGLTNSDYLASKKYVDSQNDSNSTTVSLSSTSTGVVSVDGVTAAINKFGQNATISVVEKTGEDAKDYTVSIPSLTTTDTIESKNIVTTIDAEGNIAIAINEQEGPTGSSHKLAQAGYVDEKVASVTYTGDNQTVSIPTEGDDKNKASLVADTNGYLTVGTDGLNVNTNKLAKDTSATDADATNLVTKGYVEEKTNSIGITMVSSNKTLAITPDSDSRGNSFKVEMLHEAWSATTAETDFPYNL